MISFCDAVDKTASRKEIKEAFGTLALKYHPDINPDEDASRKFREIAEAYVVLRDEKKRSQYDQMGHGAWGSSSGGFTPGNFNNYNLFKDFDDRFFDLLSALTNLSKIQKRYQEMKDCLFYLFCCAFAFVSFVSFCLLFY